MKKWECGVCGHIHEGDAPPEKCPVCEAAQKMFSEVVEQTVPEIAKQEVEPAPVATEESAETVAPETKPAEPAPVANGPEKKWRCTVCGYIHTGAQPPEKCPVCHAPAAMFEELSADGTVVKKSDGGNRRWRCTVCGYIHNGSEPPESCPVCSAPKKMFVEIDAAGKLLGEIPTSDAVEPAAVDSIIAKPTIWQKIGTLILKLHLHPITVHFPNGILPVSVIFLGLFLLFGFQDLEKAAFFNNIFVLVCLPVVLLTGFVEWQKRYKGIKTAVFIVKIICALIVLGAANVLVFWRILDPGVMAADSPSRMIYLGVAAGMLAAAGIAGHLGGNLVFKARG